MKLIKDPHFYIVDTRPNGFNLKVTAKELERLHQIGELAAIDKIKTFLQQDPLGQRWMLSGLTKITIHYCVRADNINLSPTAFDITINHPNYPKDDDRLIVSASFYKYNKGGRF